MNSFRISTTPRRLASLPNISRVLAALSLLIGVLVTGCGGGSGGGGSTAIKSTTTAATGTVTPQPGWTIDSALAAQPTRKWTFLVYLDAANDLEPYATLNMNQMEQIGSSSDVNFVVQYKRDGGVYDKTGGTWTDTRRYFVTKGSATLLSEESGVDMGSAQTLTDFVTWATQAYPAQHYAIDLWSHGNGWRSVSVNNAVVRGISYDDSTGNHITVPQLPACLAALPQKWDIVTFDACLMQMAEIAYQIKDQADYVVSAEADTPADGYPYNTFLGDLVNNSGWSALTFAKDIASATQTYYASEGDVTQSVVDETQIAAVATAVNNLGSALLTQSQSSSTEAAEIATIRSNTMNYDPDSYPDFRDLLSFTRLLSAPATTDVSYGYVVTKDATIVAAATAVTNAVKAAVVAADNGSSVAGSGGLSIYLPSPKQYAGDLAEQQSNSDVVYSSLSFAIAAPNWNNYLINAPK